MCFKVKTVFMMNNSVQLCPLTVLHHQANFSVVKVPCLREAPKQTALQSNLTPHYLYVTNTTPGRLREITLTFQYLPFHISVILVSKGIRLFHSSFPFLFFFFPHLFFLSMVYSNIRASGRTEASITSQPQEKWSWVFPPTLLERNKSSVIHFYNQYWAIVLPKT